MRELPAHQLDPKVKIVWRINDAIWLTLVFLCVFVPFAVVAAGGEQVAVVGAVVTLVVYAARAGAVAGRAAAHPILPLALRAVRRLTGHRAGHRVAQALRHPVHPRAEHRHAPRAHPAHVVWPASRLPRLQESMRSPVWPSTCRTAARPRGRAARLAREDV